ncbi:hypothetical protein CYLTODRAFT_455423 [Cylindrobasidium torrendii FP15055 ss-10]|uniref:Uncharacterized protein n=1 Tax=Cylindrobasidium torrendii FP15055 ss-10 TaxID=1314674 RepID=A0A0D7B816_9AGAR|nr:hypothetical protein CYLTODRAFT_455423 [Cylindrobasidium torrendii FP15055 ss-10]
MATQVNFLPIEILQHIFFLAQDRDDTFLEHAQVVENARMAATVSHVCQHWRAAAFGLSDLWSFASDDNYDFFKEYVKRSDPSPLVLALTDPLHLVLALTHPLLGCPLIKSAKPRVHHVVLQDSSAASRICNSSALPNLHTFSISTRGSLIPAPRTTSTQDIVPFQNRCLALKNFHCKGSELPPFPVFPCLETISVDDIAIPVTGMLAPSASTLTQITFGATVRAMSAPTKVVLPVLRTLTLNNAPIVITEWLCTPALESLVLQEYTEQPLHAIVRAIVEWAQEPLVKLVELVADIKNAIAICWVQCFDDIFVAFPNVRRVRWDLPSRKIVPYFGFCLNKRVWTELKDIAVRVKGEDANQTLLRTLQKPKGVVKPYQIL